MDRRQRSGAQTSVNSQTERRGDGEHGLGVVRNREGFNHVEVNVFEHGPTLPLRIDTRQVADPVERVGVGSVRQFNCVVPSPLGDEAYDPAVFSSYLGHIQGRHSKGC